MLIVWSFIVQYKKTFEPKGCMGLRLSLTYLISKYNKSEIVNIIHFILLYIYPVHIHEYVTDHDHAGLMVSPGGVQSLQESIM